MQRILRVSCAAVHQIVVGLEEAHLISREPGVPRSIQLLVSPATRRPEGAHHQWRTVPPRELSIDLERADERFRHATG